MVSSKWTVREKPGSIATRRILPPNSEDYAEWTLEQLKVECTARNLQVVKNTVKSKRVAILNNYDRRKAIVEAGGDPNDEGEDDVELQELEPQTSHKRLRTLAPAEPSIRRVDVDTETPVTSTDSLSEDAAIISRLKREKLQRTAAIEKLIAFDDIFSRQCQNLRMLDMQIQEYNAKGMHAEHFERQREIVLRRMQSAQQKAEDLQDKIMNDNVAY